MTKKKINDREKSRAKSTRKEKEQEADLKRRIYELRKKTEKYRCEGERDTLPTKRRKINKNEYI